MSNKLAKLVIGYYGLFILSACCQKEDFYVVNFSQFSIEKNFSGNYYSVLGEVENVKTGLQTGHIAQLFSFKNLKANCNPSPTYVFEKNLVNIKITCDSIFNGDIPIGDTLNEYFRIEYNQEVIPEANTQVLAEIFPPLFLSSNQTVDLFFETTFSDGTILKDTLFNQEFHSL